MTFFKTISKMLLTVVLFGQLTAPHKLHAQSSTALRHVLYVTQFPIFAPDASPIILSDTTHIYYTENDVLYAFPIQIGNDLFHESESVIKDKVFKYFLKNRNEPYGWLFKEWKENTVGEKLLADSMLNTHKMGGAEF